MVDFAEVRGAEQQRQLGSDESGDLSLVLDAIALLLSWRSARAFKARVRYRSGMDAAGVYTLEVHPDTQSYRLVDEATGIVDSFDGVTRELVSYSDQVDWDPSMLTFEPRAVRLAFPLALDVWGRSLDGWRMTSARRLGDEILVSLQSTQDPHLIGTLTVDTARRMATRLDTPLEFIRYESVEPLEV